MRLVLGQWQDREGGSTREQAGGQGGYKLLTTPPRPPGERRVQGAPHGEGQAGPGNANTPACCLPCVLGANSPGETARKSSESWVHGVPRAGGHTVGLGWPRCPPGPASSLGSLAARAAGTPFTAPPADPARPSQNSGPQCGACPADSPAQSPLPQPAVCSQPSLGSFPRLQCGHTHPEHLAEAWPPPAPLLAWPPRMRGGVA